jgi:hypothetical protein
MMADDGRMSLDEFRGILAPLDKPSDKKEGLAPAMPSQVSREEFRQQIAPKPEPSVGVGEDILRATGAGLGRGAVGLTGLPGDIEALGRYGIKKAGYDVGQETFLPTSEEMIKKAQTYIPGAKEALDYTPVHGPGRYARTAAEFLPGALAGPGGIGAKVAGSIGAGVASQGIEDYLKGTPSQGTASEAALKIAASIPGYMAGSRTLGAITKPFEGVFAPEAAATRRVASDLGSDMSRGKKIDTEMLAAGETPIAAVAGDKTRAAIQSASERAPEKSVGAFSAATEEARANAPLNIQSHIDEVFGGGKPVDPFDYRSNLDNARREMNDENYKRVMALPEAEKIGGPQLMAVSRAIQQDGVFDQVAKNISYQFGDPAQMGMIKTKQGWMPNPQGMPLEFWDSVKRELDNRIYSLKRGAPGPTTATDVRNYTNINNVLKTTLDNAVDEYGVIRGAAAEAAGATNAVDLGMKYLTVNNRDAKRKIEDAFGKLSDEQKASAAYGLAGAYRQLFDGKNPDAAFKMFTGPQAGDTISRFRLMMGDQADPLIGRILQESLTRNIQQLKPPSATSRLSQLSPSLTGAGALGTLAGIGEIILQPQLWAANPTAIMATAAGAFGGKLYNMKEAKIAAKTLELVMDPSKSAELARLAAADPNARSFLEKTSMVLARSGAGVAAGQGQPQRNAGGRVGRASGGRLGGVTTAAMLVAAAERAKKNNGKTTEALLNQPDEAITRALAIANRRT